MSESADYSYAVRSLTGGSARGVDNAIQVKYTLIEKLSDGLEQTS
jgi:hypothetical protein